MSEFLRSNWSDILAHIAQHVWLVLIATAKGFVKSEDEYARAYLETLRSEF